MCRGINKSSAESTSARGSSFVSDPVYVEIPDRKGRDQGAYLLILDLRQSRKIRVGKLGRVHFQKGFYIYVGSAMAHLTKRVERHLRSKKRYHWHIDKLRGIAEIHAVFAICSSNRLECEVAKAVSRMAEWSIPRFGSSDCACPTHLFGMTEDPLQSKPFHEWLQYFRRDRPNPSVT